MKGKSIQINDLIIDPKYIIAIDLNAKIYSFKDGVHYPGVRIIMAAIDGEFGTMIDGAGSLEPYTVEYVNQQAETLRPWLAEMFSCKGRSIRLPDVDAKSRNGDDAPEKCKECHKPIEVAVNERFCSDTCDRAWQRFLAGIPF